MSATEHTAPGRGPDADDELTTVVRDLSDRIEALQADVRRLGGPGLPASEPGWSSEDAAQPAPPSYAWVSSIGAPVRRRRTVPRLPARGALPRGGGRSRGDREARRTRRSPA